MPPRDNNWDCLECKRLLGWITFDRHERAHLNCTSEVVNVRPTTSVMVPTPHYAVRCTCGVEREFYGVKVHLGGMADAA